MFDPHEPGHAPKRFQEMYYDKYPCDRFLLGYTVPKRNFTSGNIEAIKGQYAAEVAFSDL